VPAKGAVSVLLIMVAASACSRPDPGAGESGVLGPPSASVALAGLSLRAPIRIRLETSEGAVGCRLDPVRAPRAVALFVGLATGRARWRDRQGGIVARPMYRDLAFFRAIPGMLVQSGCPVGDGTGSPGYRIPVETSQDDAQLLGEPGALLLARYHPAPNRVDPAPPPAGHVIGSQFVITLGKMSHLAGEVSVIGTCVDLERVATMATLVAAGERKVGLTRVDIEGVPKD